MTMEEFQEIMFDLQLKMEKIAEKLLDRGDRDMEEKGVEIYNFAQGLLES